MTNTEPAAKVRLPADAPLKVVWGGEPDMTPSVASNYFTAPTGNHVAIQLPTETYLIIAHLNPETVLVGEGDVVAEDQSIGQCGNSGNASEPHIHIHHQRQNLNEYPIHFAQGLPLFFRDHVDQDDNPGTPMPEGCVSEDNGTVIATGPTVRHNDE